MSRHRTTGPAAVVRGTSESRNKPKAPAVNFWARGRKPREATSVLRLPARPESRTPPRPQHPEKCCPRAEQTPRSASACRGVLGPRQTGRAKSRSSPSEAGKWNDPKLCPHVTHLDHCPVQSRKLLRPPKKRQKANGPRRRAAVGCESATLELCFCDGSGEARCLSWAWGEVCHTRGHRRVTAETWSRAPLCSGGVTGEPCSLPSGPFMHLSVRPSLQPAGLCPGNTHRAAAASRVLSGSGGEE